MSETKPIANGSIKLSLQTSDGPPAVFTEIPYRNCKLLIERKKKPGTSSADYDATTDMVWGRNLRTLGKRIGFEFELVRQKTISEAAVNLEAVCAKLNALGGIYTESEGVFKVAFPEVDDDPNGFSFTAEVETDPGPGGEADDEVVMKVKIMSQGKLTPLSPPAA